MIRTDGTVKLVADEVHDIYEYPQPVFHPETIGDIADYMCNQYDIHANLSEKLYLIAFDNQMNLIGCIEVSHGVKDKTLFNFREIATGALLLNATDIVLLHNHTNHDATPSEDDKKNTDICANMLKTVGINLLSHIVIADDNDYQFITPSI